MDDIDINPFADPSISQARPNNQPRYEVLDDFNPFFDAGTNPAVMHPTIVGEISIPGPVGNSGGGGGALPPYSTANLLVNKNQNMTKLTAEDLQRQQEELDRKAAELERRERELNRNINLSILPENFPPLPSWFCIKPCFYQDINLDIPQEFQKLVRYHYYLWMTYAVLLLINVIGAIALFAIGGSEAGTTFGLSLLFFVLFTPCSYVCWFRPVYKAFRSDSSFNFFFYFFVFFMQFCVNLIQCLGISGSGSVGFISGITVISNNVGVGLLLLIVGLLFAGQAGASFYLLFKVHRIYRSSGASFAKAQEEFAQGVFSNPTIRTTAANVASNAVRSQLDQNTLIR